MKNNKKIIIGLALTLVIILGMTMIFSRRKESNIPTFLSQIFPTSTIRSQVGSDHYLIGSTEYFAKTISIGSTTLSLVVENYQDEGSIYRFYSFGSVPILLKEISAYIPPQNSNQVFDQNFFKKDITGDGIGELFIKLDASASGLTAYEILRMEGDSLAVIKLDGRKSVEVDFDEISYKDGYIYTTHHDIPTGAYSVWAIRYKLEKDILIPVEIVEFSQIKGTQDDCEIAKSQGDAKFTVIGKAKCSVLGTNFDPYFK